MPNVFISYRRRDTSGYAAWIYERLAKACGAHRIFIDVDSLPLGVDFGDRLELALAGAEIALILIGPRWLDATDEDGRRRLEDPNDFVRVEVAAALRSKCRVVPVLVDGAGMPKEDHLPTELLALTRRQALMFQQHGGINQLLAGVNRVMREVEEQARPDTSAEQDHRAVAGRAGEQPAGHAAEQTVRADREHTTHLPRSRLPSVKIFIDAGRGGSTDLAGSLADRFARHFGAENVFLDVRHPAGGLAWLGTNAYGNTRAAFIALLGPRWLSRAAVTRRAQSLASRDDNVDAELEFALRTGMFVLPVFVDGAEMEMEDLDRLPRSQRRLMRRLMERQAFVVRSESFDDDVERLLATLPDVLERRAQAANAPHPTSELQSPETTRAQKRQSAPPSTVPAAHYDAVVDSLIDGTLVGILGSGINSIGREGPWLPGRGMPPNNPELATALADRFNLPAHPPHLAAIAQQVHDVHGPAQLCRAVTDMLRTAVAPTSIHALFASLPARLEARSLPPPHLLLLTTSYDTALEQAFDDFNQPYDILLYLHGQWCSQRPLCLLTVRR
jgi:hypothetical protein